MVYLLAALSACVTGVLFAFAFRVLTGVEHAGILFATGIVGAGLQVGALIAWYLRHTRRRAAQGERRDPA